MEIQEIKKTVLFQHLTEDEIAAALKALRAEEKQYQKGSLILHAGTITRKMGLVQHGSVTIENNDMWGNRTILSHVAKGQFFAETYAMLEHEPLMVDVSANEACSILFLHIGEIRHRMVLQETWAVKMTSNLLAISSQKNLILSTRSFHTAPKTIRGRVMSYLNSVALRTQKQEFTIPFDRQQLADYLNLDRSALSKELGKMQQDGLISVQKNRFTLKAPSCD